MLAMERGSFLAAALAESFHSSLFQVEEIDPNCIRLVELNDLASTADGGTLMALADAPPTGPLVGWNGAVHLLSLRQGGEDQKFGVGLTAYALDISKDGSLYCLGYDDSVQEGDVSSHRAIAQIRGGLNSFWSVAFSPNGRRVIPLRQGTWRPLFPPSKRPA